jgi:hypothetical protein
LIAEGIRKPDLFPTTVSESPSPVNGRYPKTRTKVSENPSIGFYKPESGGATPGESLLPRFPIALQGRIKGVRLKPESPDAAQVKALRGEIRLPSSHFPPSLGLSETFS